MDSIYANMILEGINMYCHPEQPKASGANHWSLTTFLIFPNCILNGRFSLPLFYLASKNADLHGVASILHSISLNYLGNFRQSNTETAMKMKMNYRVLPYDPQTANHLSSSIRSWGNGQKMRKESWRNHRRCSFRFLHWRICNFPGQMQLLTKAAWWQLWRKCVAVTRSFLLLQLFKGIAELWSCSKYNFSCTTYE